MRAIYGRDVNGESDHKPLEAISSNTLGWAPTWLQRMLLKLQRYNVQITYVPGKQIPLAETVVTDNEPQNSRNSQILGDSRIQPL